VQQSVVVAQETPEPAHEFRSWQARVGGKVALEVTRHCVVGDAPVPPQQSSSVSQELPVGVHAAFTQ
jgi:hypothetical protein